MSRKLKKKLTRIVLAAALLLVAWLLPVNGIWRLLAFLVPYFVIGWDILWKAVRNLIHGQLLDENFLMALATVGALILGDFPEASFVMLFYQLGEWFQDFAVGKSRRSIKELMDMAPDYANVERDGVLSQVDPSELSVGELFTVLPGEKIPLDGTVEEGESSLNTAALTGESVPREVVPGAEVVSGSVNLGGKLVIRASKVFEDSTVSRILELVENSTSNKSKAENFITRFARVYTPAVVCCALLLAIVPSLITGQWALWVKRALVFLVVSCPCALVISVPLAFFGGIGGASRQGILVKGSNHLETLTKCRIALMDKTGTLTKGTFRVTKAVPAAGITEERLLETAVDCEAYSAHPIALSLREALGREADLTGLGQSETLPGLGVMTEKNGVMLAAGNAKLMARVGIGEVPSADEPGTVVHVSSGREYLGYVLISDELKEDACDFIRGLREAGIQKTVLLSGDRLTVAEYVATQCGIDEVRAELLPEQKVDATLTYMKEGACFFVGDGINDAPVLVSAHLGIAMGALGSDAAIEAADIVLMDDKPSKILKALKTANLTLRIVRENIVFALAVKLIILALSAFGVTGMGLAVFGDVGVAFLCILNSLRALKKL